MQRPWPIRAQKSVMDVQPHAERAASRGTDWMRRGQGRGRVEVESRAMLRTLRGECLCVGDLFDPGFRGRRRSYAGGIRAVTCSSSRLCRVRVLTMVLSDLGIGRLFEDGYQDTVMTSARCSVDSHLFLAQWMLILANRVLQQRHHLTACCLPPASLIAATCVISKVTPHVRLRVAQFPWLGEYRGGAVACDSVGPFC